MKHAWLCFGLAVLLARSPLGAGGVDLPTPSVTPGDVWSSDLAIVCNTRTGLRRRTTPAMKRDAYAKYGIYSQRRGQYQVDHLIPLCLGGADTQENLWPQSYDNPYWTAARKDQLERIICRRVCDGSNPYSLEEAQERMRDDGYCDLEEPDDDC